MVRAAELLEELRVTILRQREFRCALIDSPNLPQRFCLQPRHTEEPGELSGEENDREATYNCHS